ncbi:hypothetical protein [Streptomyces cyaneochromogenes]|nr:hypothetical protein [Streptomyces cyaneochromogenes]
MRPEVQAFVADGPLPDTDAEGDEIDRRVDARPGPRPTRTSGGTGCGGGP